MSIIYCPLSIVYSYLLLLLACISVPLVASFYPKHAFFKEWRYFFPANLAVAIFFWIWDAIFTEKGIWGFNPDYVLQEYFFGLPIEELLFFIVVPYCCAFTYFALAYLVKRNPLQGKDRTLSWALLLILGAIGILNLGKLYTSVTFILMSAYLGFNLWRKKDLSHFYLSFIVCLFFFFLVNGYLTGAFTPEPIVWYNDAHNLGIRMITIPVEDTFYGMLLLMMNVDLYEWLKEKRSA